MAGESESVSPQQHTSGRELLPSGAVGASGFWQWEEVTLPPGIEANEVLDLAASPNDADIAFLGTNNGLYQTADAGLTWARVATATLPIWIPEIAFAPSNSQRVYASSWELFRSDDGWQNWDEFRPPMDQLVEGVLALRARLSPDDLACLIVNPLPLSRDAPAVALHL